MPSQLIFILKRHSSLFFETFYSHIMSILNNQKYETFGEILCIMMVGKHTTENKRQTIE